MVAGVVGEKDKISGRVGVVGTRSVLGGFPSSFIKMQFNET